MMEGEMCCDGRRSLLMEDEMFCGCRRGAWCWKCKCAVKGGLQVYCEICLVWVVL